MGVPGSANLMLFGGAQAYEIDQSLRFDGSAYLNRTPGSAGNRKTWTWSGWVKRGSLGSYQTLFSGGGTSPSYDAFRFDNNDKLQFFQQGATTTNLTTTAVFRDPSAWYHIVIKLNATASEAAVFVNGVEQTVTGTQPTNTDGNINNTIPHGIGATAVNSTFSLFSGAYLAEINFIDGSALNPSSFGETDTTTGAWIPKRYSGSYGTNGFYLTFADNSGTTPTTLGKDYSGNGNNWTPNAFSVTAGEGNDVLSDTPTTNWCTWNPLRPSQMAGGSATISNGNLNVADAGTSYGVAAQGTIAVSSGKWYWEIDATTVGGSYGAIGIRLETLQGTDGAGYFYGSSGGKGTSVYDPGGTAYGNSYTSGDNIGVALDLTNGKIWFAKNGTWQASGDPAAGTNAAYTGLSGTFSACVGDGQNATAYSWNANFGQRTFAHTPPTGYKALNTANLPEPTIKDGGKYFNTVLWTGTGATNSRSDVGFQPDFVWIKERNNTVNHLLYDAVRGVNQALTSNSTQAEVNYTNSLTAFNSNGFTVGTTSGVNDLSDTYVAWCWDEGATPGFDIVTYTGTGSNTTVAHSLGVAPSMIIVKERSPNTNDWPVYHTVSGNQRALYLNLTLGQGGTSSTFWNSTSPTSTVFSLGTAVETNRLNGSFVAYCFSEVAGFSKFGSYTGNGSADGVFVYCGFKPAWIMIKQTNVSGDSWLMFDTARDTYNVAGDVLWANLALNENLDYNPIDILSNGFKLRTTSTSTNGLSSTYIFAAFAEHPFKYSTAR